MDVNHLYAVIFELRSVMLRLHLGRILCDGGICHHTQEDRCAQKSAWYFRNSSARAREQDRFAWLDWAKLFSPNWPRQQVEVVRYNGQNMGGKKKTEPFSGSAVATA